MGRFIFVSNRLPVNVYRTEDGSLQFEHSVGGLATGLRSFYKQRNSIWIGWPGIPDEALTDTERSQIVEQLDDEFCYPQFLSQEAIDHYYYGFCNKTLWPLFHYFKIYTQFEGTFWRQYRQVNQAFAETVLRFARPGDTVWVHDYHLMVLPQLLREAIPDLAIGYFLHIPFPSFELFRLLPWRNEILQGLLGADLVGFHTYEYVHHFLESVRRLLGYDHTLGRLRAGNRLVKVDTFPMGIDYDHFAKGAEDVEVQEEIREVLDEIGDRRLILSVDRLDYTKGILHRLDAYDLFLEQNPEYRDDVTMILVAAPSRTGVEQYQQLKQQVDERIGQINGKHGTIGWVPIWYLYRTLPYEPLRALYQVAEIALITPLRDGMNLIAKEFVASKVAGEGVLILSEMAGAAQELVEALIVNPFNTQEVADMIKEALEMDIPEERLRNRAMQERLRRYTVSRWAGDFVERLNELKEQQQRLVVQAMTQEDRRAIVEAYRRSSERLILLDYDGTLVDFVSRPEDAVPDERLKALIRRLAQAPGNEVCLISGRDRDVLDGWLGDLDVHLIAGHGVWLRAPDRDWEMIEPLDDSWKAEVRPILELYMDRTPGATIEEKAYSLAWHFRRADPELATVRAHELKETLLQLTATLDLDVLEGSKVIEVKNAGVNKGRAALRYVNRKSWDFILALGDDWTDEDTFEVLPADAFSIKVRLEPSKARYNVESAEDVRALLQELVEVGSH